MPILYKYCKDFGRKKIHFTALSWFKKSASSMAGVYICSVHVIYTYLCACAYIYGQIKDIII